MTRVASPIRFDGFTLDPDTRALRGACGEVILQDMPQRLLQAMLERPGEVVPRNELCAVLWPPELHVDREAGLNTAIRKLRAALRRTGGSDRDIITTVPRLGYRLDVAPAAIQGGHPPPPGRSWPRAWLLTAAAVLAVVAVWAINAGPRGRTAGMPDAPEARASYIEARSLLADNRDLPRARELFRSVAEAEPRFAPAHAYLAETSALLALRPGSRTEAEAVRIAARRALQVAPDTAVAWRAMALVRLHFDRDLDGAGEALRRAVELDPRDPINYLALANRESILGLHDQAIATVRHAVDLSPDTMSIRSDAGYFMLRANRYAEAVDECRLVLRLDPDKDFAHRCLVTALTALNDIEGARQHARAVMENGGATPDQLAELDDAAAPRLVFLRWSLDRMLEAEAPAAVTIAATFAAFGDTARALDWLERGADGHDPMLVYVPAGSDFSDVRHDPRFRKILRAAGLDTLLPPPSPTDTADTA